MDEPFIPADEPLPIEEVILRTGLEDIEKADTVRRRDRLRRELNKAELDAPRRLLKYLRAKR